MSGRKDTNFLPQDFEMMKQLGLELGLICIKPEADMKLDQFIQSLLAATAPLYVMVYTVWYTIVLQRVMFCICQLKVYPFVFVTPTKLWVTLRQGGIKVLRTAIASKDGYGKTLTRTFRCSDINPRQQSVQWTSKYPSVEPIRLISIPSLKESDLK